MVNAFGAEEPFEPHRAESHSPTPVWMWVLSLVILAWAAWYITMQWNPPPEFANRPNLLRSAHAPFLMTNATITGRWRRRAVASILVEYARPSDLAVSFGLT
jgi:hypothetical protein